MSNILIVDDEKEIADLIEIYLKNENYMYGKILSDKESTIDYKIVNGNLNYIKENNKIYECVEVIRIEIDKKTKKEIKKEKLYDEKVLIEYELPSDVKVEEM